MKYEGQKSAPFLVDIISQHGIEHVVICPGSRNAPLTLSFARHGGFKLYTVVDERSAGYFAIGISQALQKPVAIITTSGTASLNLASAVAEAYYQHIPLLVITADRPEAWIGQQNGQALMQKELYRGFIGKSFSLKAELFTVEDEWYTLRTVNEAANFSIKNKLPVHINYQISEPLYDESYDRVNTRKIDVIGSSVSAPDWDNLLKGYQNILLVIGQMPMNKLIQNAVKQIHQSGSMVILAENLSNLDASGYIYNSAEATHFIKVNPDVIIYVGGAIVSKQLKRYLTNVSAPVIRIQNEFEWVDTFMKTVSIYQADTIPAISSLAKFSQSLASSTYVNEWKSASSLAEEKRNTFIRKAGFSDLKVFEFFAKQIPANSVVHLGNSTPVRYAQIFNDVFAGNIVFESNRGVSGIDGSASTAVGYSHINKNLNFLITGDLSFQYDANALFNEYVGGNLKIIVMNNSGGNIFRIIDGPKDQPEMSALFETSVEHEFSNLAKHFHVNYYSARSENELKDVWQNFIKVESRCSLLEVFTDAKTSADTFIDLFKSIK